MVSHESVIILIGRSVRIELYPAFWLAETRGRRDHQV